MRTGGTGLGGEPKLIAGIRIRLSPLLGGVTQHRQAPRTRCRDTGQRGGQQPAGVLARPGAATDINIINKSTIILIGKLKPLPRAAH